MSLNSHHPSINQVLFNYSSHFNEIAKKKVSFIAVMTTLMKIREDILIYFPGNEIRNQKQK